MDEEKQKEAVSYFLDREILLAPDSLPLVDENIEILGKLISEKIGSDNFLVFNKDVNSLLMLKQRVDANWSDFEKLKTIAEKQHSSTGYERFLDYLRQEEIAVMPEIPLVNVVLSYKEVPNKIGVQDFVSFFNERYKAIERMLVGRVELTNLMSVNRIVGKRDRETVSLIGMVSDKQYTKNQNLVLTLEDPTGIVKVMVSKTKPELYQAAQDIVLDEVIGVNGSNSDKVVFANSILWPDVPKDRELKKAPDEAYVLFLSDLHVGSNNFLEEEFQRFLTWLKGETGTAEQRELAKKIKCIFIVGDLVDGVGIYPGQEKELQLFDIYEQYQRCAELLSQIPSSIPMVICAGNHDAMRISEPQLELYKDFAAPIWKLPNVIMVSNPALVNILASQGFSGFDILLYHGYSFDYYIANVDSIRNQGGYDRPDLTMKFLLKRRHLAPSHTSTLYMPDQHKDYLVIEKVPDIFVAGHIHKSSVANYRGITMICGSCWQSKTAFQEKFGHHPEPCKVPIVNLQTRNVKILKFGD
jgi:DNA polymerase II small subunit